LDWWQETSKEDMDLLTDEVGEMLKTGAKTPVATARADCREGCVQRQARLPVTVSVGPERERLGRGGGRIRTMTFASMPTHPLEGPAHFRRLALLP